MARTRIPSFTKRGPGREHRQGSGKKTKPGSGYRVVNGRLEHDTERPRVNGTKGLR